MGFNVSFKFSVLFTGLLLLQGVLPLFGSDLFICELLSGIRTKFPSLFSITLEILVMCCLGQAF